MKRVENKIALITGGADGIGKAIATLLAKEGAKVIVADVNQELGVKTAAELGGSFVLLDVSKEDSWKEAMATIKKDFGGLHILVNNAGIIGKVCRILKRHARAVETHSLNQPRQRFFSAAIRDPAHEGKYRVRSYRCCGQELVDREHVVSLRHCRCSRRCRVRVDESRGAQSHEVRCVVLRPARIRYPLQFGAPRLNHDRNVEEHAR